VKWNIPCSCSRLRSCSHLFLRTRRARCFPVSAGFAVGLGRGFRQIYRHFHDGPLHFELIHILGGIGRLRRDVDRVDGCWGQVDGSGSVPSVLTLSVTVVSAIITPCCPARLDLTRMLSSSVVMLCSFGSTSFNGAEGHQLRRADRDLSSSALFRKRSELRARRSPCLGEVPG